VVDGGDDEDIAAAIWKRKTAGATMVGNVPVVVLDIMDNPHTMRFSRPLDVEVWVRLTVSPRAGDPSDAPARIAAALISWASRECRIGGEVMRSRLYSPINSVPGFAVDALAIGTAEDSTSEGNIAVPFDGLARFDSSRIVIDVASP
jgi:uncharacterized phage protein gp47/JayE